ncbi:MAG: hypothetical protein P4L53_14665 [Candidatus Obscuribacterales bacterium]|nr:hypothetical protein [Candidatus Obscuribacterales bacterium]
MQFDDSGRLPPGDYPTTLDELERSILVTGDEERDDAWDTKWRLLLVQNLRTMVNQLWDEGFADIYIDGSFATDKLHPGDIDGYFVCQNIDGLVDSDFEEQLCNRLNKRDETRVWSWKDKDRKRPTEAEKGQLPMWFKYHVEMWPEYGQWSGQIHPLTNQKLTHAELFRITKQGEAKGIIKLLKK